MDRDKVRAVLVPYSPPLSPTQVDEISVRLLKKVEAPKPALKKSKSRS